MEKEAAALAADVRAREAAEAEVAHMKQAAPTCKQEERELTKGEAEAEPVVSATTAVRACANEGSTVADFSSRLCSTAQRASACAELGHNVQCARDRQADELPRALILAGLEPAIFGSEDQRLIH